MIEKTLCPDCNGPMKSRQGPHGIFWGCANYPQCKGTRDSMGRSKADRQKEQDIREEEGADGSEFRWDRN